MNGGTNWRQKNWDKQIKREKVDGRNEKAEHVSTEKQGKNEHKTNLWR